MAVNGGESDDPTTVEPDGTQLSRVERNLTELATAHADDFFLLDLVRRAQEGMPSPIAVLTNGMIIFGALTSSRAMAERNSERERFFQGLERPESVSDEMWAKFREIEHEKLAKSLDEARQDEREFFEALPDDPEQSISADEEESLIGYQRRPFLTIEQARILAPAQAGVTQVPVVRVPMSAINGWWVPESRFHPDGSYSFSMQFWEDVDARQREDI